MGTAFIIPFSHCIQSNQHETTSKYRHPDRKRTGGIRGFHLLPWPAFAAGCRRGGQFVAGHGHRPGTLSTRFYRHHARFAGAGLLQNVLAQNWLRELQPWPENAFLGHRSAFTAHAGRAMVHVKIRGKCHD